MPVTTIETDDDGKCLAVRWWHGGTVCEVDLCERDEPLPLEADEDTEEGPATAVFLTVEQASALAGALTGAAS